MPPLIRALLAAAIVILTLGGAVYVGDTVPVVDDARAVDTETEREDDRNEKDEEARSSRRIQAGRPSVSTSRPGASDAVPRAGRLRQVFRPPIA